MAEHENSIGASDDWHTPPEIFAALGLRFDLDPCAPGDRTYYYVPADKIYTKEDDGLRQPWLGMVFMNPPFGCRRGHVPWLLKFFAHGNGIAICRAYTSSDWWHEVVLPNAQTLLFPRGKTKFIRPDGVVGAAPGHGIALLGMGDVCNEALRNCGLGWFVDLRRR
jgi:DNA N-6-adenine-methyltransferase Dam